VRRGVVVKVGGSLLEWEELPERLDAYLKSRRKELIFLIAGGGRAVDLIRDLDHRHGLGDERAHALALYALDLSAHILASLVSGLEVVESPDLIAKICAEGRIPVLATRRFVNADDGSAFEPLPHNWSVTSDSIAARMATLIGAKELVLLKSAPLPEGADRVEAARLGLVDAVFPAVSRRLELVTYLNLREPGAIARLL